MKNVGLINFQYSNHNYGAVLQAAAISEYINVNLGINAEHINYIPEEKPLSVLSELKKFLKKTMLRIGLFRDGKINHNNINNKKTFEDFRVKWLPRTSSTYANLGDLNSENFNYTHVIVGSDQVWRPSYAGDESLVYFLSFLDNDIKKISYAASFGTDRWDLDETNTLIITNQVKNFSSVSVRENSGVKLCNDIFGVNAEHVLDPTLLIGRDFFERICSTKNDKHSSGVVYYKLDKSDEFLNLLELVTSELGFDSKDIYFNNSNGKLSYHNVEDWLSYIKNSEFVITDSYHCVCFSLLFNKPFLCYPNSTRGLARIYSLLKLLDLEKHLFDGENDISVLIPELMSLDYEKVNNKLEYLRVASGLFLKNALHCD